MKLILTILLVSCAWMNVICDHDYEKTTLGDAIDKTTLKMIKEIYDSSDDDNIISSPLGVMLLLSLYSAGAGEGSRQEINSFLGGGDYTQLSESYSGLSKEFAEMDPSYLTLANKIYVSKQYELNETFVSVAESYKSEVDKIDFSDPTIAADIINAWADQETQGHIKNPVSADALTPDTVAALFNVIFFQGHWDTPFNASETEETDFYVDETTTVQKPTMFLKQSFHYEDSEELNAQMLEIPYEEEGFRMVIVLPKVVDGLPALLEKVAEDGLLEEVLKLGSPGVIALSMPRFEIKTKLDLNDILPKLDVSKIFEEPAPGIANVPVKLSKAFQEAFVKVDEKGTTAGAATGETVTPMSRPIEFKANHPFLFLIYHMDKAVFVGTLTH